MWQSKTGKSPIMIPLGSITHPKTTVQQYRVNINLNKNQILLILAKLLA